MLVEQIPPCAPGSNAYIVGDVLVDAGMDANAVLERLERRSTKLRMIVLTHAHYDHTQAVQQIVEHTGALVAAGRGDAQHLSDPIYSVANLFGVEESLELRADLVLSEGEKIEAKDVKLSVLSTPGHTKGSICLFEPTTASLFSGDTVYANGSFGNCELPGGSCEELLGSLERLSMLGVERLYPGHGEVVSERAFEHISLAYESACAMLRG
ncbi:MAG: MBL fold metallo-hydrolase [Methermicoccaceae archaeon]